MAYEKQTWATGDTVTAAKLNHIEDGIAANNKFIVTLTPTSLDYSGTMDKTVAQINEAYEAGMEIWFRVILSGTDDFEGPMTAVRHFGAYTFDDFIGMIVLPSEGTLITVETLGTDDGTKQTYSTHIYALTPAS